MVCKATKMNRLSHQAVLSVSSQLLALRVQTSAHMPLTSGMRSGMRSGRPPLDLPGLIAMRAGSWVRWKRFKIMSKNKKKDRPFRCWDLGSRDLSDMTQV